MTSTEMSTFPTLQTEQKAAAAATTDKSGNLKIPSSSLATTTNTTGSTISTGTPSSSMSSLPGAAPSNGSPDDLHNNRSMSSSSMSSLSPSMTVTTKTAATKKSMPPPPPPPPHPTSNKATGVGTSTTCTRDHHLIRIMQRREPAMFDENVNINTTASSTSTATPSIVMSSSSSSSDDGDNSHSHHDDDEEEGKEEKRKAKAIYKILANAQATVTEDFTTTVLLPKEVTSAAEALLVGEMDNQAVGAISVDEHEVFKDDGDVGADDSLLRTDANSNIRANSSSSLLGYSFLDTDAFNSAATDDDDVINDEAKTLEEEEQQLEKMQIPEGVLGNAIEMIKKERNTSVTYQSLRLSQIASPRFQVGKQHRQSSTTSTLGSSSAASSSMESKLSYSGSEFSGDEGAGQQTLRLSQIVLPPLKSQRPSSTTASSNESNQSYNLSYSGSQLGEDNEEEEDNTTSSNTNTNTSSCSRKSIRFADCNVAEENDEPDGSGRQNDHAASSISMNSFSLLSQSRKSVQVSSRKLMELSSTSLALLEPTLEGDNDEDDNDNNDDIEDHHSGPSHVRSQSMPAAVSSSTTMLSPTSFMSMNRQSVQISSRRLQDLSTTSFPLVEPPILNENDCNDDDLQLSSSGDGDSNYKTTANRSHERPKQISRACSAPVSSATTASSSSLSFASNSSLLRKSVKVSTRKFDMLSTSSLPPIEPGEDECNNEDLSGLDGNSLRRSPSTSSDDANPMGGASLIETPSKVNVKGGRRGVSFLQREEKFTEDSFCMTENLMDKVSMSSLPSIETNEHTAADASAYKSVSFSNTDLVLTTSTSADSDMTSSSTTSSPRKSIRVPRLHEKVSTTELPLFEPDEEYKDEEECNNSNEGDRKDGETRSVSFGHFDDACKKQGREEGTDRMDLDTLSTPSSTRRSIRVGTLLKEVSTAKLPLVEPVTTDTFSRSPSLAVDYGMKRDDNKDSDVLSTPYSLRKSIQASSFASSTFAPDESFSGSLEASSNPASFRQSMHVSRLLEKLSTSELPPFEPNKAIESNGGVTPDNQTPAIDEDQVTQKQAADASPPKADLWTNRSDSLPERDSIVSPSPRGRRRTGSFNDEKDAKASAGRASTPGAVRVPSPLAHFERAALSSNKQSNMPGLPLPFLPGTMNRASLPGKYVRNQNRTSVPGAYNVPNDEESESEASSSSSFSRSSSSPRVRKRSLELSKGLAKRAGRAMLLPPSPLSRPKGGDTDFEDNGTAMPGESAMHSERSTTSDSGRASPSPITSRLFGASKRVGSGVSVPALPSTRGRKGGSQSEDPESDRASIPGAFYIHGASEEFQQDSSSLSFSSASTRSNRNRVSGDVKGGTQRGSIMPTLPSPSINRGTKRSGSDIDTDSGSSMPGSSRGVPPQLAQFERNVAAVEDDGSSSFMSPRRAARQMKLAEMGQRPSRASMVSGNSQPSVPADLCILPTTPELDSNPAQPSLLDSDVEFDSRRPSDAGNVISDIIQVSPCIDEADTNVDDDREPHSEFAAAVEALHPVDIETGTSAVRASSNGRTQSSTDALRACEGETPATIAPKLKTSFFRIALAMVILLATVVVVITIRAGSSDDSRTSNGPTTLAPEEAGLVSSVERRRLSLMLIRGFISSEEDLKDPLSPQAAALDWIVFNDTVSTLTEESSQTEVDTLTSRYILGVIYYSLGGLSWFQAGNWLDGESELCSWGGVLCSDGSLTSIDLSGNNLKGSIPSEIQRLSNLKSLSLSTNQITGVGDSLGPSLEWLDLSDNKLTGELPDLFGMTSLVFLNLASNMLSGTLPWMVGNLFNLRELYLDNNYDLNGKLPLEFFPVESLKYLDISSTMFETSFADIVHRLPNLEFVSVQRCDNIYGTIPPEIGNLTTIEHIFVGGSKVIGTIPTEVGQLTKLSSLYAGQTYLEGPIPSEIGMLSHLTELGLEATHINSTLPSEVGNLRELEYINLQDTMVSGTLPVELGKLPNLASIFISGSLLTGEVDFRICNIPSIDRICVAIERQNVNDVALVSSNGVTCTCGDDVCRC